METSVARRRRELAVPRVPGLTLLALCLLVAAATVLYLHFALRVALFQNDEQLYLEEARYVAAHFPAGLFQSGVWPRGPQRLDAWLMAIPFALTRGPRAFELAHVLQAALFASTAFPAFLLARRTGLGTAGSLFAAALSVAVPWASVSTSYLAECAAYPAYAWVLYASWVAIERPSLRVELLLVVALAAAVLSRTAMLTLIPLAPLAALWQEWRYGLPGASLRVRARELAPRMWARHRVLSILIVLGLLALVLDGLGALPGRGLGAATGGYGVPHLAGAGLLVRYREYLSRMAVGTGFLALMLALPWLVTTLLRPARRGAHATAVVCLLGLLAMLVALLNAGPDERYLVYAAVPLAVLTSASLFDAFRGARWTLGHSVATLLCAAGVIALILAAVWPPTSNPYDFFAYPAAIFYQRVVLEHFGSGNVPLLHSSTLLVVLVLGAIAVAWTAVRASGVGVRPAAGALAVVILAACLIELLYGLRKFTDQVGAKGPYAAQRSWVDARVPAGAQVGALALSLGETPAYTPVWRETEFWNTSVSKDVLVPSAGALPLPLGSEVLQLHIAPNGLLRARRGVEGSMQRPVPRYLLVPQQGTNSLALNGRMIGVSSYLPLELVQLYSPPSVRWSMSGESPEGFIAPGQPVVATAYPVALRAGGASCASFSLFAPPGYAGRLPYRIASGPHVAQGGLLAGQTLPVKEPLDVISGTGGPTAKITVLFGSARSAAPGAPPPEARLAFFEAGPCR